MPQVVQLNTKTNSFSLQVYMKFLNIIKRGIVSFVFFSLALFKISLLVKLRIVKN